MLVIGGFMLAIGSKVWFVRTFTLLKYKCNKKKKHYKLINVVGFNLRKNVGKKQNDREKNMSFTWNNCDTFFIE